MNSILLNCLFIKSFLTIWKINCCQKKTKLTTVDNNDDETDYVVTYNEGDIIECIEPQKRTGYYFAGWYTTQNSKYNFKKSTENQKLSILKAKFIKTDNSLFSSESIKNNVMFWISWFFYIFYIYYK